MNVVSMLEKLLPARLREPLRIWIITRIAHPIRSYVDLREDLFGRSELLVQMLEQRLIRAEQAARAALNAEIRSRDEQIGRLELRIALVEQQLADQLRVPLGPDALRGRMSHFETGRLAAVGAERIPGP